MKRVLLFLIVPALVAAFALTSDTTHSAPPPNYLALGDSLGVGVGASDPATTGYVPLFRDFLESEKGLDTDLTLNNLSISGATSSDLLEKKGQLSQALKDLKKGNVAVITVDIGGNDVFALASPGSPGPPPEPPGPCFFPADVTDCLIAAGGILATFESNFDSILGDLRTAAGPDTTIIVMTYYNPLPGCVLASLADLGDIVLEGLPGLEPFGLGPSDGLNDRIKAIAASHGAEVADTFGKLPPDDLVGGFDCLHPVDSGYAEITEAFREAFND